MMSAPGASVFRRHLYLFALSFVSLFVELLLVRWVSTEVRIFAYFRNLVLVSCFIGLGIGFNLKRFRPGLLASVALMTVLAGLIHPRAELAGVSLRKVPDYLVFPEFHYWYSSGGSTLAKMALGFSLTTLTAVLLAAVFSRSAGCWARSSSARRTGCAITASTWPAACWAPGASPR
jgi:hypothetical protein